MPQDDLKRTDSKLALLMAVSPPLTRPVRSLSNTLGAVLSTHVPFLTFMMMSPILLVMKAIPA